MFKLISLAMHFSVFNHRPIDPVVVEMLQRELSRDLPKAEKVSDQETGDDSIPDSMAA